VNALIEPFIDPEFLISQQITSLVKFAHVACALFLKHESTFLPQHLYSDLQCMVRTAIFRVAHTKILDPEHKVFLCLLGDDVLKVLFGRVRMIGAHSPNVNAGEMQNRVGSALRLDAIFEKYPKWIGLSDQSTSVRRSSQEARRLLLIIIVLIRIPSRVPRVLQTPATFVLES
jgi:hypothetical protein